jgi:hypothetical protein
MIRRGIVIPEYEEVTEEDEKDSASEALEIKPLRESPLETPSDEAKKGTQY